MRFLLIPLLALSTGTPAVARTLAETTACVKVGEIDHRWIGDTAGWGDVSFQIQVTNTCGRPKDVYLQIEMLDSDGFLLETTITFLRTVRPGSDTVRIKYPMKKSVADQVARYEVTVEPLGS